MTINLIRAIPRDVLSQSGHSRPNQYYPLCIPITVSWSKYTSVRGQDYRVFASGSTKHSSRFPMRVSSSTVSCDNRVTFSCTREDK